MQIIQDLIVAKMHYKTTYAEAAKALGVNANTITGWVKGRFDPSKENAKKLREFLNKL